MVEHQLHTPLDGLINSRNRYQDPLQVRPGLLPNAFLLKPFFKPCLNVQGQYSCVSSLIQEHSNGTAFNSTALGRALSPQCSAATAQASLISFGDLAQGCWHHVLVKGLSPVQAGEIVPVSTRAFSQTCSTDHNGSPRQPPFKPRSSQIPYWEPRGAVILLCCRGWGEKAARERIPS